MSRLILNWAISLATSLLLNGLAFGGLVFLLAAGLSVIFGLMDVLNLAHGSFYMLGAYVALTAVQVTHSFWLALLVVPIALALLGAVVEIIFIRPLYARGHLMQVLLTFGMSLIFIDLVKLAYGPATRPFPAPAPLGGTVQILGANLASYKLFVIAVAVVVAVGLLLAWHRLKIGAILRAGLTDKQMVGLLGIDLKLLYTLTFAFGAALAGLAGVIAGPYLAVYPGMDENVLILALIVVVIGGLGSIEGAIAGALVVGLANAGSAFIQNFAIVVIPGVMAAVLLLRPGGLFGQVGLRR